MPNIDLKNYEGGREQAYVKHYLLKKYLSRWGYKIGSKWDTLVFVDGFAGPWGAKDREFSDASFGIALESLTEAVDGLLKERNISIRGVCIFVEKDKQAFAKLDAFSKRHSTDSVRSVALRGLFNENTQAIDEFVSKAGTNPFKFVFLDQKGWAATPMSQLRPFVQTRPCELLFTLMTSHLTRFVDLKELTPAYESLYGRPGVIDRIRSLPKGTGQREEAAVEEYCTSLKQVCGFQYVSRAIIMDPEKERVRYYLVFATNSLHGIDVFKTAEREAANVQDDIRYETHLKRTHPTQPGLFANAPTQSPLLTVLRKRYAERARQELVHILLSNTDPDGVRYEQVFSKVMELPLFSVDDLLALIRALHPYVRLQLAGSPKRRKPSPFKDDRLLVLDREGVKSM